MKKYAAQTKNLMRWEDKQRAFWFLAGAVFETLIIIIIMWLLP